MNQYTHNIGGPIDLVFLFRQHQKIAQKPGIAPFFWYDRRYSISDCFWLYKIVPVELLDGRTFYLNVVYLTSCKERKNENAHVDLDKGRVLSNLVNESIFNVSNFISNSIVGYFFRRNAWIYGEKTKTNQKINWPNSFIFSIERIV